MVRQVLSEQPQIYKWLLTDVWNLLPCSVQCSLLQSECRQMTWRDGLALDSIKCLEVLLPYIKIETQFQDSDSTVQHTLVAELWQLLQVSKLSAIDDGEHCVLKLSMLHLCSRIELY